MPVISGAGSNDTAHSVRHAEQTQEAGVDAVLVVAPYYSRPSQEGIFRHYRSVNASADKPIIIYDVPGRTGVHIQLDTYRRLAELDHVTAVKDATGDIAGAVRKRMETGLDWYSGDDGLSCRSFPSGRWASSRSSPTPRPARCATLATAFGHGDIHQAQRLAVRLAPLVEALNGNGFQAVMAKAALHVRGCSMTPLCVCRMSGPGARKSPGPKPACAPPACCNGLRRVSGRFLGHLPSERTPARQPAASRWAFCAQTASKTSFPQRWEHQDRNRINGTRRRTRGAGRRTQP